MIKKKKVEHIHILLTCYHTQRVLHRLMYEKDSKVTLTKVQLIQFVQFVQCNC